MSLHGASAAKEVKFLNRSYLMFPARLIQSPGKRRDRILGLVALVTIALAWWIGVARQTSNIDQYLPKALPQAVRFESQRAGL